MGQDGATFARKLRRWIGGTWRTVRTNATVRLAFATRVVVRNLPPNHRIRTGRGSVADGAIVGMIRLRNEATVLNDSLDHLAEIVDGIVVYDDASTDDSVAIALAHPAVLEVIVNRRWRAHHRIWEETANRRMLYRRTVRRRPSWVFYADADERFEGAIRAYLQNEPGEVEGVRVELFDAYLTKGDSDPIRPGEPLMNARRYFGIERRRILMAWRPRPGIDFRRPDSREPEGVGEPVVTRFRCQHYGKAMSVEEWERTCEYYLTYFPEIYVARWESRRGRAIHEKSDFGTELRTWDDVGEYAVDI